MKISSLIEKLQAFQNEHGDLSVCVTANGIDSAAGRVALIGAGQNSSYPGSITGPHRSEPARVVIA